MSRGAKTLDDLTLQTLLMERADDLRGYVRVRIPNHLRGVVDAEDVVQEVWTAAFRGIGGYREQGPRSFERWLYTIAARKVLDAHKAAQARKRGGTIRCLRAIRSRLSSAVGVMMEPVSPGDTPSRATSAKEASSAVELALDSLPAECREAIQMRYIEGRAVSEIATRTNRTVPAIRGLLYRGLQQLRQQMGNPSKFFSDAASADLPEEHSRAR